MISSRIAFAEADIQCQHMIKKNSELSVRRQAELLNVNRSTLYYEAKEPEQAVILLKEEIMSRIDYWHTEMPYLGSRRIRKQLMIEGYVINRKTVRKYMAEMGIYAIYPKPNLSKRNFKESIVPYLLRNVKVCFPNQVWSIDITYISFKNTHMYLTGIIDWYSRRMVGWKLSDTLETSAVMDAVKEAIEKNGIPCYLNSDQGSQFTSKEYKDLLKSYNIRQSMDGKSRWADNIMIERWFRSFKTEYLYINEFQTPRELRKGIESYINQYNQIRPHSALDDLSPDEYYFSCFKAA